MMFLSSGESRGTRAERPSLDTVDFAVVPTDPAGVKDFRHAPPQSSRLTLIVKRRLTLRKRRETWLLDVQVLDVEGMFLDELPSRFDLVPHEHPEHLVGCRSIDQRYLDHGSI